MKEERLAKQRVKEQTSMSHEPLRTNHVSRNLDQGSRRKFRGFGYSDEPLTEVSIPRSPKPLTFKNKIEEYLWRSKNN